MIDEQDGPPNDYESPGGSGGRSDRTESGRTMIQDQRLLSMALRRGWFKGQRWATDATINELQQRLASGELTVRDRALLTTIKGLTCGDGRVEQRAVGNVLSMERQNQVDENGEEKDGGVQLNVGINISTAGERRDRVTVLTRRLGIGVDPQAPANGASNGHPHTNGRLPHSNGNGNGKPH